MSIRDILISALRRIGREDLAVDMEDGGEPLGEGYDVVQTLLYCINATEDELARYYFPLKCTETLISNDKTFYFSNFSRTPVRILNVESGGREVKFKLFTNYITADAEKIDITYCYAPAKKTVDGTGEFGGIGDGNITALGAAAEYCLICGEASLAEVWETRYREAIDRARSVLEKTDAQRAFVPPRRWI